jgi:Spy/CpxP family protein refolding chaperone
MTIVALVTTGAASFALALPAPSGVTAGDEIAAPSGQPGGGFKKHLEKKRAAMAELLGLNDTQKAQIKAIVTATRQANAPLRQKLAADRKKVKALADAAPFDEAAVRALLASDEAVKTDLAVSRIKVKNQIQTLLTPEQQEKAKQLRLFSDDGARGRWGKGGL